MCVGASPVYVGASPCCLSRCPADWLLLQVPTQAVLEGDALTLRCRAWKNTEISDVQFFHDGKLLQDRRGDKLLLSPAQQRHSGRYHCKAYVSYILTKRQTSLQSDLVVRGEPEQGWLWGGVAAAVLLSPPPARFLPRALLSATAERGGSPERPRGQRSDPALFHPRQRAAAPPLPAVLLLPGWADGGGATVGPPAPGARAAAVPLGVLQLPGADGQRAETQRPDHHHCEK